MNKIIKRPKNSVSTNKEMPSNDLLRINAVITADNSEKVLSHVGVLGMRWGVRNDDRPSTRSVESERKSMYIDVKRLSDQDLANTVKRLETEKKLKALLAEDIDPGRAAVNSQLSKYGGLLFGAMVPSAGSAIGGAVAKAALKRMGLTEPG